MGTKPLTEEQRARRRELARKRYHANPEVQRERTRKYIAAHPERRAKTVLASRTGQYGIDVGRYQWLLYGQRWRCAICEEPFAGTPHIDHCHETGRVRGLLCSPCNTGIGLFRDDPARLDAAAAYLLTIKENPWTPDSNHRPREVGTASTASTQPSPRTA